MIGNLGISEVLVILAVALVVFGPHRLPEIARRIARILAELRRWSGSVRDTLEREIQTSELQSTFHDAAAGARLPADEIQRSLAAATPALGTVPPAAQPVTVGTGATAATTRDAPISAGS